MDLVDLGAVNPEELRGRNIALVITFEEAERIFETVRNAEVPEIMTAPRLLRHLTIAEGTLKRWIAQGLPVLRNGSRGWRRFNRDAVHAWLREHPEGISGQPVPQQTPRRKRKRRRLDQ